MYKGIGLSFTCLLFYLQSFAQDALTLQESGTDLNVLYHNEMTGGIVVHSRGFGLNLRRGKHVNGVARRFIEYELISMKDLKQTKTYNGNYPDSKGFNYGQLNSVLVLRVGAGYQKVLFGKAERERKSVEIRYSIFVGPSLALAKPVYLEVLDTAAASTSSTVTQKYNPAVDNLSNIASKAPYLTGIGETKIYPGAYAKFGLSFEYADKHNYVRAIETGMAIDAYPQTVPIMANAYNKPYFFTLYLNFIFGRRWF